MRLNPTAQKIGVEPVGQRNRRDRYARLQARRNYPCLEFRCVPPIPPRGRHRKCICVHVSTKNNVDTIVASGRKLSKVGWLNAYDVVAHVAKGGYISLPEAIVRREHDADHYELAAGEDLPDRVVVTRNLRAIPYREVIALDQFINGHTPFATKHSVKGDEFENVVVVLGRGWNKYNFDQYLEWAGSGNVPTGKQDTFERYRNLFYVSCSRPTTRLALLFTQKLSQASIQTFQSWFGVEAVQAFNIR